MPAFVGLLLLACGGVASDGVLVDDTFPVDPITIEPRALPPEPDALPEPAEASPDSNGVPAEVSDVARYSALGLDAEGFDVLLGYYCVNCHGSAMSTPTSDGFAFDNWAALAAGGNVGRADAERMLRRVVDRMANAADMPPPSGLSTRPLPSRERQLMVDFIERALNGAR